MSKIIKDQSAILQKLGITKLNQMQEDVQKAILANNEIILLSPTGTGKTLAFLLPIIHQLDVNLSQVQVLIIVPSRELAIQIEQVAREMGSGFKTNAVYGGRSGYKDKIDLKHPPSILIGTPGRIADHLRKETFMTDHIHTIVLDEFDKSLEIGFEIEMKEILLALPGLKKKILTSATQQIEIPNFVKLDKPLKLIYQKEDDQKLQIETVLSPTKNKLNILVELLQHLEANNGIIFCNYKDTIQELSDQLKRRGIKHGCFQGGMEQIDRERTLIKFRNGTHRLIIATDLAARGIDVPELDFIIHYQLPIKKEEFIHRNGRTARMHKRGTAYVLKWNNEELPDFIEKSEVYQIQPSVLNSAKNWQTLYISGGRRDKISKGDIAGLFFKKGNLKPGELGVIELKQDCTYVAVSSSKANALVHQLNNSKIKKKKVRISLLN